MTELEEPSKKRKLELEGFAAAEIAKQLEQTQINKFHTKGGTGFAAEEVNAFADKLQFKDVKITGKDNSLNGADRIIDGVAIQTKYYPDSRSTFNAAFNESGTYRYQGQVLEVPREQYDECLRLMQDKIKEGKVPGVTDPNEAERFVKKGEVTYKQARNIARAGNVDSLLYDVKTQAVSTSYVFAISFAVQYSLCRLSGQTHEDALKNAISSAVSIGSTSLITGVIASQVLRTKVAAMGTIAARHLVKGAAQTQFGKVAVEKLAAASLGKAVYGAAAINHVSKLLRSNVITSVVATVIISTPDFYRAAISNRMSWSQFSKNLAINASSVAGGVAGWLGGAAAGAAIGSFVPIVGTAVGGVVVGAFSAGTAASIGTKAVLDHFIEDDAKRMLDLANKSLGEVAYDFLLTEEEINQLIEKVKATVDIDWLRTMYQAGASITSDEKSLEYAYVQFEKMCEEIVSQRSKIYLPAPQSVNTEISNIVCFLLEGNSSDFLLAGA
jgi:hypothetical protein